MVDCASIPERRFENVTGTTFIDYVQHLRIEKAKRLLENSGTNTGDISVAVGYEDRSFFRRLFKRPCGATPAEYRRMCQPVIKAGQLKWRLIGLCPSRWIQDPGYGS